MVEGTPAHDWLYGMNQLMRGANAYHAILVYHHLVATGQMPMLGTVENIVLSPAPAVPAAPAVAPVAPIHATPAPVLHQVPVAAPVAVPAHVEPAQTEPVAQVVAPVEQVAAPIIPAPMPEQAERTESAEATPPVIKKGLVAGFRR